VADIFQYLILRSRVLARVTPSKAPGTLTGVAVSGSASVVSGRVGSTGVAVSTPNGTDPITEEEFLKGITVQRKAAVASEIVSWRFSKRLQANESHSMLSYVSLASNYKKNPFDKAVLIQSFLRSDEFKYDQENFLCA
jgi:hypothetical protein